MAGPIPRKVEALPTNPGQRFIEVKMEKPIRSFSSHTTLANAGLFLMGHFLLLSIRGHCRSVFSVCVQKAPVKVKKPFELGIK